MVSVPLLPEKPGIQSAGIVAVFTPHLTFTAEAVVCLDPPIQVAAAGQALDVQWLEEDTGEWLPTPQPNASAAALANAAAAASAARGSTTHLSQWGAFLLQLPVTTPANPAGSPPPEIVTMQSSTTSTVQTSEMVAVFVGAAIGGVVVASFAVILWFRIQSRRLLTKQEGAWLT